jgi:hypothetical protein
MGITSDFHCLVLGIVVVLVVFSLTQTYTFKQKIPT